VLPKRLYLKIELLNNKISYYKELRRSLINKVVCRGLDDSVKLKDSRINWIGKIPEHWEVIRFKGFANTLKGKNLEYHDSYFEKSLPNLSLEYLRNNTSDTIDYCYSPDKNLIANEQDLIIIWDGAGVGEILKAKKGYVSSTIAKLHFTKKCDSGFFYFFKDNLEYTLKSIPTGMGIPHLNPIILNNYKFPIPPKEEQKRIADYLEEKTLCFEDIISNLHQQIAKLQELRKTLINDVVTGKIKVTE
jgi:type I restriction enzyme S subunit